MIVHNNTESAYDQTARKIVNLFLKKFKKSTVNAFIKFIKDSQQTAHDFDMVFYQDSNCEPVFRKTVDEAYTDALNADNEFPSFIRIWNTDGSTNIMVAVECHLFADLNADDYRDSSGKLNEEIKRLAIAEIEKSLLVG